MLAELGHPVSATGIARLYREVAGTLVIDERDRELAREVEVEGVRCIVTDTVMRDAEVSAALGRTVLASAGSW
jgi:LPPG:FO 2-phospho-L-lactate transferase